MSIYDELDKTKYYFSGQDDLMELQQDMQEYGEEIARIRELFELQQSWIDSESKREVVHKIEDDQMLYLEDKYNELNARLDAMESMMNVEFKVTIPKRFEQAEEKAHTDCIKVYRNVQAVIVEEDSKQNKVLARIESKTAGLKRRVTITMVLSIFSFIVSIALVLFLILPKFGINLI